MPQQIAPPAIPWQTMNLSNKMERIQDSIGIEKTSSSGKANSQLKKACGEMESLFVYYLLKEMRSTIPKSGFMSGGKAEEVYTSMLDEQLAKELSSKRGIGLSSILLEQLDGGQENAKKEKDEM